MGGDDGLQVGFSGLEMHTLTHTMHTLRESKESQVTLDTLARLESK